MHNGLKCAFAFVGGAAVGATVAFVALKKHYEQLAQEEIESVKEVYAERFGTLEETSDEKTEEEKAEEDDSEYLVYENLAGNYKSMEGGSDPVKDQPHVIAPEHFGENGYECVELQYWEDGVLTDDQNQIVEDVEGTVGYESLTHFGEYEDDSVHVRNDRLKCDYEILMEPREYYATISTNLNPSGTE